MAQINERRDPHSASNSDSFSIKHLHLDWDVDFEQKAISGSVLLSIHPAKPAPPASKRLPTDSLVLDTKALSIKSVFFIAEGKKQECRVISFTCLTISFRLTVPSIDSPMLFASSCRPGYPTLLKC